MANVLDRRKYAAAIPQLEKKMSTLTDYITVENGVVKISAKDLYMKGSELTVSLEEIGMKYVDKDKIIAEINASEEGIKIAAEIVNIEGATIFSEYLSKEEAEDTYAELGDASGKTQRIYYRKSANTAPAAPSTWVTSEATVNNTWTTKRMPYSSSYKYLFTCVQQEMADGTIECTTVLLDDTTTVIDGGNIITGSITANAIASNTITTTELAVAVTDSIDVAGKTATTYIRNVPDKGLCICRDSTDNDNVLALTSGNVNVYTGGTLRASYGATTQIGASTNTNYLKALSTGMQVWDSQYGEKAIDLNGNHSGTSPYIDVGWDQNNSGVHTRLTDSKLTFYTRWGNVSLTGSYTQDSFNAYIGAPRFISDYTIEAGTRFVSPYTHKNPSATVTETNLYVNSNGTFMKTASSSRRYKCDIEDADRNVFDPHRLYDIPFRQYRYKEGYFGDNASEDAYTRLRQGFIAEEVQEAYPHAAVIEDGEVETWSDRELIPPMLALIQEQNKRITELERRFT